MFIKHGDGKIMTVMPEKELTEEQKKTAEELSQLVAEAKNESDASKEKKSGS